MTFYVGNIELNIEYILFYINIINYTNENDSNDYYKYYTNAWKDIDNMINSLLLILFTYNNHYSLLSNKKI